MLAHGVGATQMEQVAAASGTSKSQLYHHFPDKHALVQAVIELRGQTLLELHSELLANVRSIRGLERWRDVVVGRVASVHGAYGCQLGTIATEIVEDDEQARASLQGYFRSWERLLSAALEAMVNNGELTRRADPDALAQQIMVALQGGYLLSQVERSEEPMRRGLDMALDHVRNFGAPHVPPTD
jgi:TetR/AcrR family transcriptional regulator, transcriptional repressor for nem operon